ncbi:hypothetical protein RJ639_021250 [Escallonia herrerae]|uniref:Pentatricopeptide repeat-containing protein n=1 Tax=Escallonia herrerae TaxID=1293975 RepID=A0AA88V6Q1_9ASTE|nr:hypothetical protein RJ639_021250 [Escallonia herrerae]
MPLLFMSRPYPVNPSHFADIARCINGSYAMRNSLPVEKIQISSHNLRLGQLVHSKLTESKTPLDSVVLNSLITLYSKCNDWVTAKSIFEGMDEKKYLISWSACFTHNGMESQSVATFTDMLRFGECPNEYCFATLIQALLDMYAKCASDGSVDDVRKVFDRLSDRNVMSWSAIITGYVQSGGLDKEAIELCCRMIEYQVSPNHFTISSLLKACRNLSNCKVGEQVYNHAIKLGLASDSCVGNSLINMYAQCGSIEDAQKAFEILFEKKLVSYNTIVDCYAKNLDSDKAFELINQIGDTGMVVDAFTFACLLSGAASVGAVGKGEEIHGRLLKSGFESNKYISDDLISMYSRCGNIEAALKVFSEMEGQNVISWTSMITVFPKHGFVERALELFSQMLEAGIKLNTLLLYQLVATWV